MAYRCGKTVPEICQMLNFIVKRVYYALHNEPPTFKKFTGRFSKLEADQRQ